ncbi:MAG: hypothetical protein HKN94_14720 [Acidimicrobiales bacterium]|nr:hypothetical protein [Acidimicrobiales bacterium]RZV45377.1 MAG: hypothetical protein EX269_10055 [Acidimicrobiales bacterium]
MTGLVTVSVIAITLLIAGLAFFLFVLGTQLSRIATLLEECAVLVWKIKGDAEAIEPGLEHINHTGGVVAGALPLLYGFAEDIVTGATYEPRPEDYENPPALPAMGSRRSRLMEGVGYRPE